MSLSVHRYLAAGIAILGATVIGAVLPPSAVADGGGAGGSGGVTVTGPGGTPLGSGTLAVDGTETIPNGLPGTLGCLSGGCSGGLTVSGTAAGPGGTPLPTGLQIGAPSLTVSPPQPNALACITAQCFGGKGTLSIKEGAVTSIIGASGGLNGYIHG
ncbi:hypothetical protein Mycsm_04070 [Mycobacterium sp. JS623]|nr:hypothetical protein Mycsm_04070 [Mycobacterium sp. JS623]